MVRPSQSLCHGLIAAGFVLATLVVGDAAAQSPAPTVPEPAAIPPSVEPSPPPTFGNLQPAPAPGTTTPPTAESAGTPAAAPPKGPTFDEVWNNGLFFESPNKNFVAHVGGTVHYDGAWYTAQPSLQTFPGGTGPFHDGFNMRRGRLFIEGSAYTNIDYKFEIEFMNGFSPAGLTGPVSAATVSNSPGPTDAWVTVKNVPGLGNVRVGSQKEWFSLEHLNGYRYLEFMERSYLFDFAQATAFNNGFSPGISAFRTWANDRVFSAVGVYKNESDLIGFGLNDGQYAVTGRVAFLPCYRPEEKCFWHVGGAMSHRDPVNDQVQVRIRNNVRNAPFPLLNLIANTGVINATSQELYNLETAAVYGPATFQAEYTANVINGASVGTGPGLGSVGFQGYYAEALVFLTGESRTWDTKNFIFRRVTPMRNFLTVKHGDWCLEGPGAWEFGVRYSHLDLNDKGIAGGHLNSVTVGVTWYLNPNVKMQTNYDYLYRDQAANALAKGSVHSLGTRLAFDF